MAGAGGGFLAGFTQGLGNTAQQFNQNYLDMQMRKYQSAAKIWETMGQDQNYHPNVRQQFMQNAMQLSGTNVFDKNSRGASDEILKTNPHDAATQAFNAQDMTGAHPQQQPADPNAPFYDQSGYSGPSQKIAQEAAGEKAKIGAQHQATLDYLQKLQSGALNSGGGVGGGQQPTGNDTMGLAIGTVPGSDEEKYVRGRNTLNAGLNHPLIKAQHVSLGGMAAKFYPELGMYFGLDGAKIDDNSPQAAAAGTGKWLKGSTDDDPTPRWIFATPGDKRQIYQTGMASSTSQTQSPDSLTTTTQRTTMPVGVGGGRSQKAGGQQANPQAATTGTTATAGDPNIDKLFPQFNERERLAATRDTAGARKVDQARSAMAQMDKLHQTLQQNQGLIGPVMGRVNLALNKAGAGGLVNWAQDTFGLNDARAAQKIDQFEKATSQVANDPNETPENRKAATTLGEIITQMRAINGLELVAMSGSGNGITRLYMMLKDAMMQPTQSMDLIDGHMRGLAKLFAGTVATHMERTRTPGQGVWSRMSPSEQQQYQDFGAQSFFHDAPQAGQTAGGNVITKFSPSTKLYYKSMDGGKTWQTSPTP